MEKWIIFATILTIMNILGFLILKYIQDDGILVTCYMSLTLAIISIFVLLYLYKNNQSIIPKNLILIITVAILSFIGSFVLLYAISNADNPGNVRAFVSLEIVALFILYNILKHQKPCFSKIIGIILIGVGIYLITN